MEQLAVSSGHLWIMQNCSSFCGAVGRARLREGRLGAVASPGFNGSSEATVPEQLSVLIWTAGWHPPPTSQEGCEAKLINVCKTL